MKNAAATNEGQKAVAEIQKKFEPQKNALDTLKAEIDTLTKQLQNAPATMSDDEKASRARTIDTKQKQWQRDGEDAQTAYANDVQEAVSKIEEKLGPVVMKYVQQNGFTMPLNTRPAATGRTVIAMGPGNGHLGGGGRRLQRQFESRHLRWRVRVRQHPSRRPGTVQLLKQ